MSKRVSKFATPGEPTTSRGLEAVVEAKNGKWPWRRDFVQNYHFWAKIAIFDQKWRLLSVKWGFVFLEFCRFGLR